MYWCNLRAESYRTLALAALLGLTQGCKPDIKESGAVLPFFDVKGYFKSEINRLTKANPEVDKKVIHDKIAESRKIKIANWKQELELFTASDINRPAWKNSYIVTDGDSLIIYRAKYPELKTREMVIKKIDGKVHWILVFNKTKNILYQTNEKLSYFPDSLYLIEKDQRIRLMKNNHYSIEGRLKP